uniref:Ribosomal protein S11 n=1 Tax=Globodera rostochiensis TaxID=31243 RepID=A0A914HYV0_GLORO
MLNGSKDAARQAVHSFKRSCEATVEAAGAIGGKVKKWHCGRVGAICGTGATGVGGGREWHERVRNFTLYVNLTNVKWLVMHAKKLGVVKAISAQGRGKAVFGTLAGANSARAIALRMLKAQKMQLDKLCIPLSALAKLRWTQLAL